MGWNMRRREILVSALYSLIIFVGALLPLNAGGAEMTLAKDEVGQLWLQIIGRIDEGDDLKFKVLLVDAINRGEQITDVATFSQGGQTLPAIKIGRYIRTLYLRTVAPYLVPVVRRHICYVSAPTGPTTMLEFDPINNRGDERCTCAAECFLIWAAGLRRSAGAVQLHRLTLQGEEHTKSSSKTKKNTSIEKVIDAYLHEMGAPDATIMRMYSISADELAYLTKEELNTLTSISGVPWLKELLRARCGHYAASSPAALECENTVIRELYWNGARELLRQSE
jgi:hypothetical protein